MSYLTQDEIANNRSMQARVAQSAVQELPGGTDVDRWTYEHRRSWAAAPGWDAAWESSKVSNPDPDYDPGRDGGVITDGMILSQVQLMLASP
jgi:hypothetical protein